MKPMVFITFPNSKRLDQKLIYHEIDFLHAIYDYEIIFFFGVMKAFGRNEFDFVKYLNFKLRQLTLTTYQECL